MTALRSLAAEIAACRRYPLYRRATQAVPGEGPRRARLILVGEQPGNDEDISGKPFVGPGLGSGLAGGRYRSRRGLRHHAVKHFKVEPRGKRRLHKRPNAAEIAACHVSIANAS